MKHNEEKNTWKGKEKKKKPRKTLLKKHLIPFLELAEIEYKYSISFNLYLIFCY